MRFLRLEILNLASLDNPEGEVIEFEKGPLGRSNIFSIVGATGSGKSTILDALCLALYDRTPRFTRRLGERKSDFTVIGGEKDAAALSSRDTRNILTRGRKEGYSKLTFIANDGKTYRAQWSVEKKRVKYEKPRTSLWEISERDGVVTETECDWDSIPEKVGLDFEQFLNTVVLAQGAFARFLKSNEAERVSLLEKLLGNEGRFADIAIAIKQSKDEAMQELTKLCAECDAYRGSLLEESEVESLKVELSHLKEHLSDLKNRRKQLEDGLRWYAGLDSLKKELADAESVVESLARQWVEFAADNSKLRIHDDARSAFPIVSDIRRVCKVIAELTAGLVEMEENILRKKAEIQQNIAHQQELDKAAEEARMACKNKAQVIVAGRQSKTLITEIEKGIKDLKKELTEAETSLNKICRDEEDNRKRVKTLKDNLESADKKLLDYNNQKGDVYQAYETRIAEYTVKIEELNSYQNKVEITTLRNEKGEVDASIKDLQQLLDGSERRQAIAVLLAAHRKDEEECKQQLEGLCSRRDVIEIQCKELEKEIMTLSNLYTLTVSDNWEQHRHNLHEGEKCPLCGSESHPYILDNSLYASVVSEMDELLNSKREKYSSGRDKFAELSEQVGKCERRLGSLEGSIKLLVEEDADKALEMGDILHRREISLFDKQNVADSLVSYQEREKQLDDEIRGYGTRQEELTKLSELRHKEQSELTQKSAEWGKTIQGMNEECGRIKAEISVAENLKEVLSRNLADAKIKLELVENKLKSREEECNQEKEKLSLALDGQDPDELEKSLNYNRDRSENEARKHKDKMETSQNELSRLQGEYASKQKFRDEEIEREGALKLALDSWLVEYNADAEKLGELDYDALIAIIDSDTDWDALRERKETLIQNRAAAHSLCERSRKRMDTHVVSKPEMDVEQIMSAIKEIDSDKSAEREMAVRVLIEKHERAEGDLGRSAALLKEATAVYEDWKEIADAVGGDGKMLRLLSQCYALGFLIEHANAEIRRFNKRYELVQVKNSLDIRVIDHDLADDVRAVTSLSGGETFIVSLGLALGLSSLSSRNISFDNLFIDEGFGTLDHETLATVIDSLAALQMSQGKKVGVISHTEAMSERIPTQIRVVKKGSSGSSRIEIV